MRCTALLILLGAGAAFAESSTNDSSASPPVKKPYGVIDTLNDDRVFDVGDPQEAEQPRSRTTPRGNTFYLGEPSEINSEDSARIKQECQFALEKWGMAEYRRCYQEKKQQIIDSLRN